MNALSPAPISPSWILSLLSSGLNHLDAIAVLLEQGHGIITLPDERVDGRGLLECLAFHAPRRLQKGLQDRQPYDVELKDPSAEPSAAEVVFTHALAAGVNPWIAWTTPPTPSNPSGVVDGFDLAYSLGSKALVRACLDHPDCPDIGTLQRRSAWRLSPRPNHGVVGSRLNQTDSMVSVALAGGLEEVARVLLEHGWPINPSRGNHPTVCARTPSALQLLQSWKQEAALPPHLAEVWRDWAVHDPVAKASLAQRLEWLGADESYQPSIVQALGHQALIYWQSEQLGPLKKILDSVCPPEAGESEKEAQERHARAWLSFPNSSFTSGDFNKSGPAPAWLMMASKCLAARSSRLLSKTGLSYLASMSAVEDARHPLGNEVLPLRGAGLLLAARQANENESKRMAFERLDWTSADRKEQGIQEAVLAAQAWAKHGTGTHRQEADKALRLLLDRWLADPGFAPPALSSPCWPLLSAMYAQSELPAPMLKHLNHIIKDAPLEWCFQWLSPLSFGSNSTPALKRVLEKAHAQSPWSAEALTLADEFIASPRASQLPSSSQWDFFRSMLVNRRLDASILPAPSMERSSRVRM